MRLVPILTMGAMCLFPMSGAHAIAPDDASFAYYKRASADLRAARGSLAEFLQDPSSPYLRNSTENMQLAAKFAAWRFDLPTTFFLNLIHQESSFRPFAVSRAGALGIAQFMPSVASWRGLQNPLEPKSALMESARYLAELRSDFGNLGLAAAAYNAGPARLRAYLQNRQRLPNETRHYVLAVTGTAVDDWAKSGEHDIKQATASGNTPSKTKTAAALSSLPHAMPQPHQFAIGRPVPPEILASERAVLSRHGWKLAGSR
jgi:hypothetical protein